MAERGHLGEARGARSGRAAAASPSAVSAWARAYAQGRWSIAAELLGTIPEASRTPSHWLHLGRAREKLGQLVEAFDAYQQLRDRGAQGKSMPGFRHVQRQLEAEANAIERRIPWAHVDLGGEVPADALVFVDQQWLAPARLLSPYPVNPGWHTILLEWQGQVQAAERVHFEEGQSRQVVLQRWRTGATDRSAVSMGSNAAQANARGKELAWQPVARAPEDGGHSDLRTASYISLGVGVLGLAVGTGYTIAALERKGELNELAARNCGSVCLDDDGSLALRATDLSNSMHRATTVANTSFAVAGLGLLTGSVLLLLGRDSVPAADVAGVQVQPLLGAREAGVTGRF